MIDKNSKDYYNHLFHEEIKKLNGRRPKLFLHACCGPCLTYPLDILSKNFDVTIGFFNPNIRPYEEYLKRLEALKKFVDEYSIDNGLKIDIVVNDDDFEKYDELFKDRKEDKEGGKTCLRCHAYRMNLAYEYASKHDFEYFTTVMTVSCKKPSKELNEIAFNLAKKYPNTKYLYSDFKKENGQLCGIKIAKQYNIYRQDYCGCLPSLRERIEYLEMKKKESL